MVFGYFCQSDDFSIIYCWWLCYLDHTNIGELAIVLSILMAFLENSSNIFITHTYEHLLHFSGCDIFAAANYPIV